MLTKEQNGSFRRVQAAPAEEPAVIFIPRLAPGLKGIGQVGPGVYMVDVPQVVPPPGSSELPGTCVRFIERITPRERLPR